MVFMHRILFEIDKSEMTETQKDLLHVVIAHGERT